MKIINRYLIILPFIFIVHVCKSYWPFIVAEAKKQKCQQHSSQKRKVKSRQISNKTAKTSRNKSNGDKKDSSKAGNKKKVISWSNNNKNKTHQILSKSQHNNVKSSPFVLQSQSKEDVKEWIIDQAKAAKNKGFVASKEAGTSMNVSVNNMANQARQLMTKKKELEEKIKEVKDHLNDLQKNVQTQETKQKLAAAQELLKNLQLQNDLKKNALVAMAHTMAEAIGKNIGEGTDMAAIAFLDQALGSKFAYANGIMRIAKGIYDAINFIDETSCYDGRLNEQSSYCDAQGAWKFGQEQKNGRTILHARLDVPVGEDEVRIEYFSLVLDPKYSGPYVPIESQIDQVIAGNFKLGDFSYRKRNRTLRKEYLG